MLAIHQETPGVIPIPRSATRRASQVYGAQELGVVLQRINTAGKWQNVPSYSSVRGGEPLRVQITNITGFGTGQANPRLVLISPDGVKLADLAVTGTLLTSGPAIVAIGSSANWDFSAPKLPLGRYTLTVTGSGSLLDSILGFVPSIVGSSAFQDTKTIYFSVVEGPPVAVPVDPGAAPEAAPSSASSASILDTFKPGNLKGLGIIAAVIIGLVVLGPTLAAAVPRRS